MCENCVKYLHQKENKKKHDITSCDKISFCKKHEKRITNICIKCNLSLCNNCTCGKHKKNTYSDLIEANDYYQNLIDKKKESYQICLDNNEKNLKKNLKTIEKLNEENKELIEKNKEIEEDLKYIEEELEKPDDVFKKLEFCVEKKLKNNSITFIKQEGKHSYKDCVEFVKSVNARLPTIKEVQKEVKKNKNKPFYDQDVWVPVSDYNNEWVSIGNIEVDKRIGKTHSELFGYKILINS
jgi:hypothetical protein